MGGLLSHLWSRVLGISIDYLGLGATIPLTNGRSLILDFKTPAQGHIPTIFLLV
jgi:hypothetical protein